MKDSEKKRIQLGVVLQYLRQKQKLVVNPSYRYDLRNVIMSLKNQSIDSIKQQFVLNDNHIDLQKFIWLLRNAIDNDHADQLIHYQLTRLFQEIDVDGSSTIEWTEFLEFLSESAWAALSPDNELAGRGIVQHDKKILFHAFSETSKYRKQAIKKIIEIPRNGVIGIVARNNQLQFIDYHQQQIEEVQPQQQRKQFSLENVDYNKVLSLDYSEEERLFGVLMSNRNLCFIEQGEIHKTLGVIRSSGSEVEIYYLPLHKLWVLQSINSTLHVFPSPKNGTIKTKLLFKPHQQPLTGVKQISSPFTICTASLDGTIKLWQANGRLMIELQAKREISGQVDGKKGVKGLDTYSKGNLSYICSWMFTTELFLWLPSLSLSKPFGGELKGHLGLVINALFTLKGQLISIDDRRMIRVWNPQKFQCIQALVIDKQAQGLFILKGRPYLVVYSKLMQFFRVRTNSKADLQNEIGISGKQHKNLLAVGDGNSKLIATAFSAYYSSIIIVTNHEAKIFEVNNASLRATILPETEDEQFVAMSMQRMRRVYIASSKGVIYQYKIQDGSMVKKIPVYSQNQICLRFIFYHETTKMLLVVVQKQKCSQVITYDKLAADEGKIKEIEFNQVGLIAFEFDSVSDRFYVLSLHFLTIWSYQKLNITGKIQMSNLFKGWHVFDMLLESSSGGLLLFSREEVMLLAVEDEQVSCDRLQLHKDKGKTSFKLLTGAIMKQKISSSYLQDLKFQKTQRQMVQTKKKQVNFKQQNQKQQKVAINSEVGDTNAVVLALTDIYGQTLYYNITDYLPPRKNKETPLLKGKFHRLKEKRIAHMKYPYCVNNIDSIDLSFQLFTEQIAYIPKTVKAGTVADHFYLFSSETTFYFFNVFGVIKGEWNMSLTKPRIWQIAFNQIELVLARLERTQQALVRISKINGEAFKSQFLMAKYLTEDQLTDLMQFQERRKAQGNRLSVVKSKKSMKSIENASQNSKSQVSFSLMHEAQGEEEKDQINNVFARQADRRTHKKHFQKNTAISQLVQKTLKAQRPATSQVSRSNSVKIINQHQQKSPFLQQIQGYFTTGDFVETPLEHSSVKSSQWLGKWHNKAESKQQRLAILQKLNKQGSGLKNRLKSSVSQMSRQFKQGKIEYTNFMKKSDLIIAAASGSLGRKGKVHLKL